MSNVLREELERDGERVEILIEVDELPDHSYRSPTRGGSLGSLGEAAKAAFSQSADPASSVFSRGMRLIRTFAEEVADTVQQVSDRARPQEVEVKFGVKLSAEAGALIAKTGTEAHMEVTLKWKKAE